MRLTFHGVRGSCPCPCEENRRYGGNTACVVLDNPGAAGLDDDEPIVFDLGTGLRLWADRLTASGALDGGRRFAGTALVTHIHWDHVQGLPFFPPVHVAGARLDVYGPHQEEGTLSGVIDGLMRPPYFPVMVSDLAGDIRFHDVTDESFAIGHNKVTVRPVPHVGPTVGYRVDTETGSVAYVSDHQAPADLATVAPSVLDLCHGVDVLIHDAQYTLEEFRLKETWGHCTMDYALLVAQRAGAKRLVLFHHDPAHSDDVLDLVAVEMAAKGRAVGVEVIVASEGLVLDV